MAYNSTSWATDGATKVSSVDTGFMYVDFFIDSKSSHAFAAGYHEMLRFNHSAETSSSGYTPNLGNGSDPATSFTTADANENKASILVYCLWYIPDDIYVDEVYSLEGADEPSSEGGDTTRMHLMSFDFNSGVSACLTNGTLVAHNSDVTNSGNEQPYLSTAWPLDSPSVSSGKVIVATFESDTINSDYSVNVKVKYHLT